MEKNKCLKTKFFSKTRTFLIAPSNCQAYAKDSQSLADLNDRQPMPVIQEAQLEKLKMLNVFEPCTLQIGKFFDCEKTVSFLFPDNLLFLFVSRFYRNIV